MAGANDPSPEFESVEAFEANEAIIADKLGTDFFNNHMVDRYYKPGDHGDGWDIESGNRYAMLIESFLRRWSIPTWVVRMHWEADTSYLVAERYVEPPGFMENRTWVERVELTDVLGNQKEFAERLTKLMYDVLKLATILRLEPTLTEEG